jgi:hypothetical protein
MSAFFEFLQCRRRFRADLDLKAAILAAGFIVMLILTRGRGAK